jgi:penicillin-binding protein 1A
MFKIQVYTIRNPVGVKKEKCLLRWRKEILLRKRKETQSLPITLDFKLESHREGSTYFREYLRDYMKNGLMKTKADGSDYDIYKDGLKIYTLLIRECSCMLKRLFLLTWQIFRKNFLFRQKNKTLHL